MSARKTPQPRLPNGQFRQKDVLARTTVSLYLAREQVMAGVPGYKLSERTQHAVRIIIDAEFEDALLVARFIGAAVTTQVPRPQDVLDAETLARIHYLIP